MKSTPNSQRPTPKGSACERLYLGVGSWKLGTDTRGFRMKSAFSRAALALVTISGAVLIASAQVAPPLTPAPRPQGAAQGAQAPGQPAGRGGRGGLGGPQENDPANATADYGPKPPIKILTPRSEEH